MTALPSHRTDGLWRIVSRRSCRAEWGSPMIDDNRGYVVFNRMRPVVANCNGELRRRNLLVKPSQSIGSVRDSEKMARDSRFGNRFPQVRGESPITSPFSVPPCPNCLMSEKAKDTLRRHPLSERCALFERWGEGVYIGSLTDSARMVR